MKDYIKNEIKHIPMILVVSIMFYGIATYAIAPLFNSNEVSYDNTVSGIKQDNVQGAIDELYACTSNYSAYDTRLTNTETAIGTVPSGKTVQGQIDTLDNNTVKTTISSYEGNVNDMSSGGAYSKATNTNNPTAHPYVFFSESDGSNKAQIALRVTDAKPFIRTKVSNGSFTEWKELALSGSELERQSITLAKGQTYVKIDVQNSIYIPAIHQLMVNAIITTSQAMTSSAAVLTLPGTLKFNGRFDCQSGNKFFYAPSGGNSIVNNTQIEAGTYLINFVAVTTGSP